MPRPALRAGATTLYAPDPLLCSANYVGGEVAQLVFAMPQGAIVLVDASPSLALHVLPVPPVTWSRLAGVCIDSEHEQVVLLDTAGPSFLRIDLADLRAGGARFRSTPLPPVWGTVRGIAFDFARDRIVGLDPDTGELLQHSAIDPTTRAGTLPPVPRLLAFGFAPAGGLDHDLFISSGDPRMLTSQWTWSTAEPDVETATLRATVATSAWSPPSPDPSSITYDNFRDRLIVADGEVDEMSIYAGSNVFEASRAGIVSRRSTTTSYSDEPVGITFQSASRTFYISDDDQRRVHVVAAGPDGLLHTSDDTRRSFSVSNFCTDPEDVAFSNATNELWVAGGETNRVHRLRPGNNGIFDGTSPNGDDQVLTITVSSLGVSDPEGIAVRPIDGGIYVMGQPKTLLLHLNASGQVVRTVNLPSTGLRKPAGLVFAPRSSGTGDSLYVVDREIDNDTNPSENDGMMFEYGVSGPTSGNQAPVVNAGPDVTILLSAAASLAGTATDDGLPGPLTIQWSKLSGPGTASFAAPGQAATTVTFSATGSYTLQLSAFDGALTTTDTAVVTVQAPPPGSGIVDRTIATSDDDAEEGTSVNLGSTDLEMVLDGTVTQVIGLRFQNLTIPAGSFISSAYVQFTTDETTSAATQLTIAGQASDNAPAFVSTAANISSRPRTTATVGWAPASWTVANEAGPDQRTPNLASIVQQITNRPGWNPGNSVVLVLTGTGTRTASAYDRSPAAAPKLTVNYQAAPPVNQPPVVNAGPDVTTLLTAAATLSGTVTDDGLPGPLTIQWSKLSGPGSASFAAPNQAATTVTFSASGSYTLQLNASDGALTTTDTAVVTVQQPANQAPVVNAGPDVTTLLTAAANLAGTVIDDGLPGPLTIQWSKLSGPGTASFAAPSQASTTVTFSASGSYTLQLSAFDGALTTTDTAVVTVQSPPAGSGTVERTIAISDDDAEESSTGSVNRGSSDLEMVLDGTETQIVGLRFQNLTIPAGSFITSAFVQFTCDEATSTATQLTIAGQASDNAPAFAATAVNISSRPRTTATVAWAPVSWTTANEAGLDQRTPGLASIVQQVVNRPGWVPGNSIVFVITGTGSRIASAFDRSPATAARLTVNYQSTPPVNQAPVVNAGPDVTTVLTAAASLAGTVFDDGLPGPLTIQWSKLSGPGTATFAAPNQAATTVAFSAAGSYTLQLSASDGALTTTDTAVVTVQQPANQAPVVNAGPDVTTLLTAAATLAGTVTDDGLPGPLTIQWSKLSGPGTATFAAPNQAATTVTFSASGSYTLQLSAFDGALTTTDTAAVTVQALPPPSGTFERVIAASGDDAEEGTSVHTASTDLEMVLDGTVTQVVGLRFQNLTIPAGSFISSAYVQFTCDEATSTPTQLTIAGQASDNAPAFATTAANISSRPRTTNAMPWTPASWAVGNEAGPDQRTPNLASIVQQVINRPGWSPGNSIVFVITGTGCRIASAFDDGPTVAPKLVLSYQSTPPPNLAPVVNAGPDVTISQTMAATLAGTATDDGLPSPLTIQWSKLSGPGTATFAAPNQAATTATFSLPGSYTLQLSAFDGGLTRTDTAVVTVLQTGVNQPPTVNAGPDVTTLQTSAASLAGSVTDDGHLGPLTIQWSKLSGPGTATFAAPSQAATTVTFSLAGSYSLQLSAFDGEFTRTDTVLVTAQPPNLAPTVNAGPDLNILITSAAHLVGTVTDDGLPGGPLTIQWSKLSGPGTVNFTAPTQPVTNASFSAAGIYTLRLSAFDGGLTSTDSVVVTVDAFGSTMRAIANSNDDAEERPTSVNATSSDLEMVLDGTVTQVVGLRFQNLTIPAAAVITSAYIQFTVDQTGSTPTLLTFAGQASDNAPAFATTASNISSRPRTTATVDWATVPWTVVNEAGPDQLTPDLASIVQEITSRPGWSPGNAMVFVVTGSGTRIAAAFDSSPAVAARLIVNYQ